MSAERSSIGPEVHPRRDLGAPATRSGLRSPTAATTLAVDLPHGWARADVRVRAEDRTDASVDVRPSDPSQEADVLAAEQTRVVISPGEVHVSAPNVRRLSFRGPAGSVDIDIAVPVGSDARIKASGGLRCQGRLGEAVLELVMGDVWVEHTGPLRLRSGSGDVSVTQVDGDADVTAGNGRISLRGVNGTATVSTANGDIAVGDVGGDLRTRSASGHITVDRAGAAVVAKTANGSIRVGEAVRGAFFLETAAGAIKVGLRAGTAALLDVRTRTGNVRTALETTDGPEGAAEQLVLRARTAYGDIVIHRADATPPATANPMTATDPTRDEETR